MADDTLSRPAASCRLLVRTKTNVAVYDVPEASRDHHEPAAAAPDIGGPGKVVLWEGGTSWSQCSPDGRFVYLMTPKGVIQFDMVSRSSTPLEGTTSAVLALALSPTGAYATTWERPTAVAPLNLKVFRTKGAGVVAQFHQKAFKRDSWPSVQFTHDEKFAFLLSTSEIRVYPIDSLLEASGSEPRYAAKLHLPGLASFSLPARCGGGTRQGTTATSSSSLYLFTTFCAGSKNQPAKAALHEFRPASNDIRQHAGKSLFQAEEMKTHWSPLGDAALITLQTSVDVSGQSYYGSSQLFLLSRTSSEVLAVPGVVAPVLDVAWMPHPDKPPCFAVVSGKMPALASLHHGQTAQQLFLFGSAHRNVVSWSPHGRFVVLAGFGNLAGGMGFWDRNKLKLLPHSPANASGSLKADNATSHGWSPDSRMFVTSTCSPRMNVANGIRLWRYTGEQVRAVPWNNDEFLPDQLLQAQFLPALLDSYPDRPQSPPPPAAPVNGGVGIRNENAPSAAATAAEPPADKPKSTAYVPPSARNRAGGGGGTSLAERMRKEKEASTQQATKVVVSVAAMADSSKRLPVGMTEAPKSKSATKRDKLKAKKKQEVDPAVVRDEPSDPGSPAAPTAETAAATSTEQAAMDPEKRGRKLKKLLKQIQGLKGREPEDLNDDQKAKLASEATVLAELAELGL